MGVLEAENEVDPDAVLIGAGMFGRLNGILLMDILRLNDGRIELPADGITTSGKLA